MTWRRRCTEGPVPDDPVGAAAAAALSEVVSGASVELLYAPAGTLPTPALDAGSAAAVGLGPPGWDLAIVVRLESRVARLLERARRTTLAELLDALPAAGLRAAERFRRHAGELEALSPPLRRALRDDVATEILAAFLVSRVHAPAGRDLVAETIEYLIELSGTRVEAHDLTHGVIVADVLHDEPRLQFRYPSAVRAAKRAPLLFDGQRSVLVVDPLGRARTELERHRFDHLVPDDERRGTTTDWFVESGSLVADASRVLEGVGFFVRADRSIWTFVDGQPLLVRRGEHWTAFPLELTASIANMIDGGPVAEVVARTAFLISTQPSGAILAIVRDASVLDDVVPTKDRYDLRHEIDHDAMRPETRLHHLIDPYPLDEHTLARLATLDGATVVDRDGHLLAYGAIVTSADSEHEGARTAAAKTLSESADVVLKVSVDGDITIFRDGAVVTTLLGHPSHDLPSP